MIVRLAREDDDAAILDVHRRAFGDEGEEVVRIVQELRAGGYAVPELAFVAEVDGRVVGSVLSSWVGLEGAERRFLQLSPLGVLPEHQRRGHGGALVRASLDGAGARREPLLFVEGNPAYYGRFGFVRADELGWPPPPEALFDWAFQVAVLDERADLPRGRVVYPPPFRH
ncbi:MAG TPA: N-acetyltransferase [Gaiellaceae bacterium]|nr:N-acetyltransferase [Gaiellaceae bacterium]